MSTRSPRASGPEQIAERVRGLPRRFRGEAADGLSADWELRVGRQIFAISVADHACFVREGPSASPQAVVATDPDTWVAIDDGALTGGQAFLERRLSVAGNLDLAVRLQAMFRPHHRARKPSDFDQVDVSANGYRLSCYVLGKGDPLLLLHGLGGTKITWFPVLMELAEHHRLIVPDL